METAHHLADSLPEPSLYEILEIAKDAPLKSIRTNYRKCLLQCHPNRVKDDEVKEQKMHEFHQVQQAYEILSDEKSRICYDERVFCIRSTHVHPGSTKPLDSTAQPNMAYLAKQIADEERRALVKYSRVMSPISQRDSSYYRPGPHKGILPDARPRPRPPRRRFSVYPGRGSSLFNIEATNTAHQRMATAAHEATGTAPELYCNNIEDKENHKALMRRTDGPELANKGTYLGVEGVINGITVHALADTGADKNFMNEHFSQELHLKPIHFRSDQRPSFVMGHGGRIEAIGKITVSWNFRADIRKDYHPMTFYILPECIFDVMIGGSSLFETATMDANRHRLSRMPRPRMALAVRMVNLCGWPSRRLKGVLNLEACSALPDTGAEPNLVSYEYAKQRGWLPKIVPGPESCRLLLFADGSTKRTEGQLRLAWSFDDRWDIASPDHESRTAIIFDVLYGCPHDVILGQSFLEETDAFIKHKEAFEDLCHDDHSGLFLVVWACDRFSLNNLKAKISKKNKSSIKPAGESDSERERGPEDRHFEQELQFQAEADERTFHAKHNQDRRDAEKAQQRVECSDSDTGHPNPGPFAPPTSSLPSSATMPDWPRFPASITRERAVKTATRAENLSKYTLLRSSPHKGSAEPSSPPLSSSSVSDLSPHLPGSTASSRNLNSCKTNVPRLLEDSDSDEPQQHRTELPNAFRNKKSSLDLSREYISTASSVISEAHLNLPPALKSGS